VVTCALPLRIGGESRNKQVSEFRLALPHQMVSGPAAWSAVSKVSSTRTMFKKQDMLELPRLASGWPTEARAFSVQHQPEPDRDKNMCCLPDVPLARWLAVGPPAANLV